MATISVYINIYFEWLDEKKNWMVYGDTNTWNDDAFAV